MGCFSSYCDQRRHNRVDGFVTHPFTANLSKAISIDMNGTSSDSGDSDDAVFVNFYSQLQRTKSASATPKTTSTLIILNSPIVATTNSNNGNNGGTGSSNPCFDQLWKQSDHRICADGGANRLHKYNPSLIPNLIRGDLDSLQLDVRSYYEQHGVRIERDPCQDTNDLDKALQSTLKNHNDDDDSKADQESTILIYGAFGGRFDQEMASIQALYKWGPKFNWQIYLYSDETCAFLLPANLSCRIQLPFYDTTNTHEGETTTSATTTTSLIGEGPTCGLIPLGACCESIVTDGFKWDLDGTVSMEFGGLVSTSNRLMKPTAFVRASHPVVFTAELTTVFKK